MHVPARLHEGLPFQDIYDKREEMSKRIGDPTREKWLPFLGKALELGYITAEEHEERVEILLKAKTGDESEKAYTDLPWEDWNRAWNKRRDKGLCRKTDILPDSLPEVSPFLRLTPARVLPWVLAVAGWVVVIVMAIR